ncbi:MAG: galactose mutarotase [Treponema sp.]|nr:galactose mutarotase [Treponema sp.]
MSVKKEVFGKLADGREAYLFTLTNKNGMRLMITNFGGRMVQLWVPDRKGNPADVITGFDSLEQYQNRNPYFGALVGRYANRIANSTFSLNGKTYNLNPNQPPDMVHHLHGGYMGFSYLLWDAQIMEESGGAKLRLALTSPDGDQGYPGRLDAEVIYTLTQDNSVSIKYSAKTDADTVVNLTNHVYFNLRGHNSGNILGHRIRINSDSFLPTDAAGIPNAAPAKVDGTPFDLRIMTEIGSRYSAGHLQLKQQAGFDHHFYLDNKKELRKVCEAEEPEQTRRMEVWTTKPGIQFYMGNKVGVAAPMIGKGGFSYKQYCAFCLETQYPPDGPNGPDRAMVILRPDQEYRHETVYKFV